jgi:hypothetical protein
MTPEERSNALKQEADVVMKMINLEKHCEYIGKPVLTGSYFMDLMMYPDIDLYLPVTMPDTLLSLAMQFAKYDCVRKINFEKGGPGDLAKGLYLKPMIEYGNWGRLWKIDIWSLSPEIVQKKQKDLLYLKTRMTPEQRKCILEYKYSILNESGRTPMFSGIYIYQAVINLGMMDFNDITEYLRNNNISI